MTADCISYALVWNIIYNCLSYLSLPKTVLRTEGSDKFMIVFFKSICKSLHYVILYYIIFHCFVFKCIIFLMFGLYACYGCSLGIKILYYSDRGLKFELIGGHLENGSSIFLLTPYLKLCKASYFYL